LFAQQLSPEDQVKMNQFNQLATTYLANNNPHQASLYLTKMAYLYWENKISEKAIEYFNKALETNKTVGNRNAIWVIHNNIGMIYSDLDDYKKALDEFQLSLQAGKEMKDKEKMASTLNNIALMQSYLEKFQDSNNTLDEALRYSQELNNLRLIRSCYAALADNYKRIGNKDKEVENYQLFSTFDQKIREQEMLQVQMESAAKVAQANEEKKRKELDLAMQSIKLQQINDSLEKVEQINRENQMRFDLMKKEHELKEQKGRLEKELYIKRIFIIGFIVILCFLILLFIQIKQKIKVNKELHLKNEQLEAHKIIISNTNFELQIKNQQLEEHQSTINEQNKQLTKKNDELENKNNELEEHRRIIEEQNKQLGKQNQKIMESIRYAHMIQEALLPSQRAIKKNFPQSFIFYKPRDIVSGDFYWFSIQGSKIFIAAVDCTGHSVPGAFMSLIGNTLLKEIIIEKKISNPAEILKYLNEGVIQTLRQEEEDSRSEDGMDISLCCIDKDLNIIEIAATNNSVYLVNNGELITIEGDYNTIGGVLARRNEATFTKYEIPIKEKTSLYIFSDGYYSQIGGKNNKTLRSDNFRKILFDNCQLSMLQQEEMLGKYLQEWKNDQDQTDDILVIGIQI
jgi:serine phosphatase RsbU (regulator of sigma subunit)